VLEPIDTGVRSSSSAKSVRGAGSGSCRQRAPR
jgi:hypothetical protein